MSYQSFLFGFEELALDAVQIQVELVTLFQGFLVLSDDIVYVFVDLFNGGFLDLGSLEAFWGAILVEFVKVFR